VVLTQTKTSRVVEGGEKGTRTFWHLFERSEAVERLERLELPDSTDGGCAQTGQRENDDYRAGVFLEIAFRCEKLPLSS
jgi:hypothetical protein